MTDDADKWPSYADELTRKGMSTLTKWIERVDAGKATGRDLYIVADVLWDAMSGLAPRDALQTLEDVLRELRQQAARKK